MKLLFESFNPGGKHATIYSMAGTEKRAFLTVTGTDNGIILCKLYTSKKTAEKALYKYFPDMMDGRREK